MIKHDFVGVWYEKEKEDDEIIYTQTYLLTNL